MTSSPIGVAPSTSLATLNQIVTQQEDVLGPLVAIGNDGAQTILTFDTDPPSPTKHAVIAPDQSGQPVIPAGSTQVARGSMFVFGTLTPSTASRPA